MPQPRDYVGKDLAPYSRFRPTRFYGGCYTADIMYCNWSCDHCWSQFGWRAKAPKYELTSDEVVEKLVKGCRRNDQPVARMTGGEPSIYWASHVRHVAQKFVLATQGEKIIGERPRIFIESNGTAIKPDSIRDIERTCGDDAARIHITVGVKATSPARLAKLTGQTVATARRFQEAQLALCRFLADPDRVVSFGMLFLDAFTDDDELNVMADMLHEVNPGIAHSVFDLEPFRTSGWGSLATSHKDYTPKRHRNQEDAA